MQPSVYDDILPNILLVILRLAETIETLENSVDNQQTERTTTRGRTEPRGQGTRPK